VTRYGDISIKAALAQYGWSSDGSQLRKLIEWIAYEVPEAVSISKMSAYYYLVFSSEKYYGNKIRMVTDPRGYSIILDDMIKNIKD